MNSINSFLLKLCKNPFIRSLIATSPRWHCSANAGRRTPPLLLCKHQKQLSSLSLSHTRACSLSLTPCSNTCLPSFVWLSFPSLHPKATKRFLLASAFSLTSNYPSPAKWERRWWGEKRKKNPPLPPLKCFSWETRSTMLSTTLNIIREDNLLIALIILFRGHFLKETKKWKWYDTVIISSSKNIQFVSCHSRLGDNHSTHSSVGEKTWFNCSGSYFWCWMWQVELQKPYGLFLFVFPWHGWVLCWN